jgi:cytochrome c peroxidase
MISHRRLWSIGLVLLAACASGCESGSFNSPTPPPDASLDVQVRQVIRNWGVVPILPVNAAAPALVDLGRMLFFDKILSGNRDVACATCHSPLTASGDGQSLAVGTAATNVAGIRRLGVGREFTPRNAPSLFNVALGTQYMFWDGRVSEGLGLQRFQTPAGVVLPGGLSNLLAVQAMLPVTNRVEMRGVAGDRDVLGNVNELAMIADTANAAIWDAAMRRVLAVSEYVQRFSAAYPGVPASQLGFQHAANAIAAFEAQTFTKTNTGFDRYLARDDNALSIDAKRGALLFFGKAQCSTCHNGPMLGAQSFASAAVPQFGPGTGSLAPLDGGREGVLGPPGPPATAGFFFRVAPLRNVELTAPYMHDGAYNTLEEVVRHYNNADSALKAFDSSRLDPSLRATYRGDATTIAKILAAADPRLRLARGLTPDEQGQLVAFLKSLTDPSARDMSAVIPATVPSGLPVRDK